MWLIFMLFLVSGIQMSIVYFTPRPSIGSAGWPLHWSVYRVSSRLTQKAINYMWRSCLFLGLNPLNLPLSWLACWYWACLSNITRWVLKVGLLQACFPRFRPARLHFRALPGKCLCISPSGKTIFTRQPGQQNLAEAFSGLLRKIFKKN